jgi:hypothetical protein
MKTEQAITIKQKIKDFVLDYIDTRENIWYNLKAFTKDFWLEYDKLKKFMNSEFKADERHINNIKYYKTKILDIK